MTKNFPMDLGARSLAIVGVLAAAACSDSENGPATSNAAAMGASGLDRNRTIASLSGAETSTLCDWSVAEHGGPGKVTDCGGGRSVVAHTKEECTSNLDEVRTLVACYAPTIAEFEDCSIAPPEGRCAKTAACEAINARLETCAGKD